LDRALPSGIWIGLRPAGFFDFFCFRGCALSIFDFARLHLRASAAAFIRKRRFMCLFHSRVACRSCCISSAAFKGYAAQGQRAPHEHTAAGEIVQFAEGIVMAQVDLRRGVLDEQRQRRTRKRSTKSSRNSPIM
jgi:hypothetical protein